MSSGQDQALKSMMGMHFHYPGDYHVRLHINVSYNYNAQRSDGFGSVQHHQFHHNQQHCGNNWMQQPQTHIVPPQQQQFQQPPTYPFHYNGQACLQAAMNGNHSSCFADSSSGVEDSFTSNFSAPGIASNSWIFATPLSQNGHQFDSGYGNSMQWKQNQSSSPPTKQGCFSLTRGGPCNIS